MSETILRQLRDEFDRGYPSLPPLRSAVLLDVPPGAKLTEEDWKCLLLGEGVPWEFFATRFLLEEIPCSWCWFTDRQGPDLRPSLRAYTRLADQLLEVRPLQGKINGQPMKWGYPGCIGSNIGRVWVEELHRLGCAGKAPLLQAMRYRFHNHCKADDLLAMLRVNYTEAMEGDEEMLSPPLILNGNVIRGMERKIAGARLAFPHRFLSILLPDVWRATALAIDLILSSQAGHGLYTFAEDGRLTWPGNAKGFVLRGGEQRKILELMAIVAERPLEIVLHELGGGNKNGLGVRLNALNLNLLKHGAPFHLGRAGENVQVRPRPFVPKPIGPADGRVKP